MEKTKLLCKLPHIGVNEQLYGRKNALKNFCFVTRSTNFVDLSLRAAVKLFLAENLVEHKNIS